MAPKYFQVLISGTSKHVTLHIRGADGMKWENYVDYPGGHCNHGVLIRGRQGDMMTDLVVGVTWSQVKECRQLLGEGKARSGFFPELQKERISADTFILAL